MNISKSLSGLKTNPIFQLSLASKELFHSNFLYWLSFYNKEQFKNLIEELAGNKIQWPENPYNWKVLREDNNMDLCIRKYDPKEKDENKARKEYLFVLENKVKSIATKAQLTEYYEKVGKENKEHKCSFCLLSLSEGFLERMNIEEDDKSRIWVIKSYSDLAKALKKFYLKDNASGGELYIIEQYHRFIEKLNEIAKEMIPSMEFKWEYTAINEELKDLHIDDLRQKIIANKLAVEIAEKLSAQGGTVRFNVSDKDLWKNQEKDKKSIFLTAGFTNGRLLVHLSKFIADDKLIRLEIEGNRYKRGVIHQKSLEKQISKEDTAWIFNDSICKQIFVENKENHVPDIEYPEKLKKSWAMKQDFGTYDMKQLMKYQSVIIPEDSTLSEVVDAVVEDFNKIFQ